MNKVVVEPAEFKRNDCWPLLARRKKFRSQHKNKGTKYTIRPYFTRSVRMTSGCHPDSREEKSHYMMAGK